MYLSITPGASILNDKALIVKAESIPVYTKIWILESLYPTVDWFFDRADDTNSFRFGQRSVENFYSIFFDLFPDAQDREEVLDTHKNWGNISPSRIKAGK
jgi:hypothetical protein